MRLDYQGTAYRRPYWEYSEAYDIDKDALPYYVPDSITARYAVFGYQIVGEQASAVVKGYGDTEEEAREDAEKKARAHEAAERGDSEQMLAILATTRYT